MGCGGSKKVKSAQIELVMQKTGNLDIDILFDGMIGPLEELAGAAESIRKGMSELSIKTGTYLLNNNTIDDSITVILYALSSISNGDFNVFSLKITEEPPYLQANKKKIPKFIHESIDAWIFLVSQLTKAEEKLNGLPEKIAGFINACADFPDKVRAICEKENMTILDTARMLKVVVLNSRKINRGPAILDSAKNSLSEILDTVKGLAKKLERESLQKIHEIGKKIQVSKAKTMKTIVVNHWHDKSRVNLKLELLKNGKPPRRSSYY